MEGLKDLHRSGRPPEVSEEIFSEIRSELSENPSGWKTKEIMNIIYQRTGVRYHEVHVYRLLHKWGFKPKVPQKRFINIASKEEKEQFKKRLRKKSQTYLWDSLYWSKMNPYSYTMHWFRRRMWVPEGKRPIVIMTGSHQKTCVFGALSIDGRRQLFRQYDTFDRFTFLDYLKKLQNKFHKVILFLDRAPQHYRSIIVRKYFEKNKDILRVEWFPKGSPEFNAVEECWRQGKDDLLVSKHYPKFHNLRKTIAKYYRTKRFAI